MKLVEAIALPNNLTLKVWDNSYGIAQDTTKVELVITIVVEVQKEYFGDPAQFDMVVKAFGASITYEYRKERTFVDNRNRETVFRELLENFKRDSLPYLARPHFPSRFALSKLRDILQNPYKYRHIR